jgi:hypothetical protein
MSKTPRTDLDLHWIEAHGLRLNHKYVSYVLAQDLERQLNEAYYIISELNDIEPKNRDYDVWDRADAWLERNKK